MFVILQRLMCIPIMIVILTVMSITFLFSPKYSLSEMQNFLNEYKKIK